MLSAVLPPTLEAARDFRTRFGAAFARLGIDIQSTDAALLVGSEIIVNIVQHAEPSARRITVDLSVHSGRWHMSIRDDGGLFSNIAEKVAEAGDASGDALKEGGMGLMLLDTHFPGWIYVPRHTDGEDNTLAYTGDLPSQSRDRKRVLLVDDEQIQLDIAAEFLNATFDVASASSVDQAQQLLEEYLPDVIVCDIRMPGTNGLEFRRRLRHSPKTSAVPFVFLTGVEREEVEAQADALAIDDFLTKPVDRTRLLAVINRVITRVSDLRGSFGNMLERGITSALVDGAPRFLGDWTCATRSEAASAGGGDMIYHHKSEDRDILVLVDVMGHGLPAKFYAHVLNGFLTGYLAAAPRNSAPSELLGSLSDVFACERILQKTIATAIAIAVEPDGNLTIASAGHAPPVLLRHGKKQDIRVSGPLLGLASGLTYDTITLETQPDDRIVFWTDGCVEIGDPTAHQDMEDRFLSILQETATAAPIDTLEQIFTHIFAQSPNGLADDATAVILSKDDR